MNDSFEVVTQFSLVCSAKDSDLLIKNHWEWQNSASFFLVWVSNLQCRNTMSGPCDCCCSSLQRPHTFPSLKGKSYIMQFFSLSIQHATKVGNDLWWQENMHALSRWTWKGSLVRTILLGVKSESCNIRLSTLNVLCREDDWVGTKADKSHNAKTISCGRKSA